MLKTGRASTEETHDAPKRLRWPSPASQAGSGTLAGLVSGTGATGRVAGSCWQCIKGPWPAAAAGLDMPAPSFRPAMTHGNEGKLQVRTRPLT